MTLLLCVVPLFQEIWSCPYSLEILASYAEDIDGGVSPSISMLSEVAAARKITIVGGSIPEKASGKVFNTCCVIGPDGQILAKHRKVSSPTACSLHTDILMWNLGCNWIDPCDQCWRKFDLSCICLRLTSQETSSSRSLIHSQVDRNLQ